LLKAATRLSAASSRPTQESAVSADSSEVVQVLLGGELAIVVRQLEGDSNGVVVAAVPVTELMTKNTNATPIVLQQPDEDFLRSGLPRTAVSIVKVSYFDHSHYLRSVLPI